MMKRIFLCICLLFAAQGFAMADTVLTEGFDDVSALAGAGWALINQSAPPGATGWFQGNQGVFTSQSGAADSYIAANFLNAGDGGNISNWLLTPEVSLRDGDSIDFYTRSAAAFADRLELRLSTNGGSTDVGVTDTLGRATSRPYCSSSTPRSVRRVTPIRGRNSPPR